MIIGAGAAGLVAAAEAARRNAEVYLLEKNNKVGVKILMSGGTRCNLTHNTDAKGITSQFRHAQRFLQPSVGAFSPTDVVEMFRRAGVATKVESTGKVFPSSNRAVHARDALVTLAIEAGVKIQTGVTVSGITPNGNSWHVQTLRELIECDRVIVTAGGLSYPGCGTTGDAYDWLRGLGHSIVTPRPALVPLTGGSAWTHDLSGVTVEDCAATVINPRAPKKKSVLAERRASWLFTHFGFSGPAAMDVSQAVTAASSPEDVLVSVDFIPRVSKDEVEQVLSDRASGNGRQRVVQVVSRWMPQRLATALVGQDTALKQDHTLSELSRPSRQALVHRIKQLALPVSGTKGFPKAEVTAGGVQLGEVDPKTMRSRLVSGLFIAGEVLDVDGPIGGYNFQAAFSTGRAAGAAVVDPDVN
ncbi:MAG: aminoacetone oxidase family FAD-binding enzyme [Planctomycetota bacterium]